MTGGALARVIRGTATGRAAAAEPCDLCAAPAEAGHRHLYDTTRGEMLCVCRACALLFARDAASQGHYRPLPQRRLRIAPVATRSLGVPVGLAFFVRRGDGTVTAQYPSPAGATQWEVDPQAWAEVTTGRPELRTLEVDVEALLINTARGQQHYWITPIDDCLRMVALVRREWTGLTGGSRVWPALEQFFADLTEQR